MTNDKSRNMQVVLRVRPLSRREMEQNQRSIVRVADKNTIIFDPDEDEDEFFFHGAKQTHRDITKRVSKNLTMTFDQVFDNQSTNEDVFRFSMRPLVSSVLQGYNCSAFVYGATGAGKTHTMLGHENNPGVTYLTMRELFEQIRSNSDERKFDIGISYLEVYNEQVMNLLTKTGPLKLREDSNGVVVGGLVLKPIHDAEELLSLLALGNRNRTQHPTDANEESSRSHAIFQVHIRMTNKNSGEKRTVKLSMIDLAGSERGSSTKCIGQRFKEGASINKSLLALGNCINKLADGSKHIPYRDSNMTRILKDSLGGNCQTVMIANISPSSLTYEDTYNTLKYASRAQKIRTATLTKSLFKSNLPKEYYVRKLTDTTVEVEELRSRIRALEAQLAIQNNKVTNGENVHQRQINIIAEAESWKAKIDTVYSEIRAAQENYYMFSSKEKLLKLRTRYKEHTEQNRKLFNIDGDSVKKDLARVEASLGKFSKQMEVYRIEKDRWMERIKPNRVHLLQLQKEIATMDNPILHSYLQFKDMEHRNAELAFKSEHTMKVIQIYNQEIEKSHKTIELSSEILQEAYLVMDGNLLVTDEMRSKLDQLYKFHDQRGIRFIDADDNGENDFETQSNNPSDFVFEKDHLVMQMAKSEDSEASSSASHLKRSREIEDEVPSKKRLVRSIFDGPILNSTQILESHPNKDDCAMNSTFAIKANTANPQIKVKLAATRALKESNPNVHKDFIVPRPFKKPIKTVKSSLVNLQREKENKKTPLKMRRSPRYSPMKSYNKLLNRVNLKNAEELNKRAKDDVGNRTNGKTLPKK